VTDRRLQELRRLHREGQLEPDLVEELRSIVGRLVHLRLLPPVYAPYGQWNDEAADEIFSSWYETRLFGRGHLQLLLDRAASVGAFRRLAEQSLRQHLSNERDRSQAQNLYARVVNLLESDRFELARDAARRQDRWWRLPDSVVGEWAKDDRALLAEAWALGSFSIIRYRADAKKLSPLLDAEELERFVVGLMTRAEAALTATLLMRALEQRFDLGQVVLGELDEHAIEAAERSDAADELGLRETARAVLAQLTARQIEVLRLSDDEDQTIESIATALACSVGTVANERTRIAGAITRFSENDEERETLLKIVSDLLYSHDEHADD